MGLRFITDDPIKTVIDASSIRIATKQCLCAKCNEIPMGLGAAASHFDKALAIIRVPLGYRRLGSSALANHVNIPQLLLHQY